MKNGKVLVISQDHEDLLSYSRTLVALGCEVEMCSSYERGTRRMEEGNFELVLLSQDSPAFEGRCVLERNAELTRHTPILVVARCLDVHCYLEAMELGALDYLERPEPKDLGWVVGTQLSSHLTSLVA
jgi:DNA-binding NtrC family response regulator